MSELMATTAMADRSHVFTRLCGFINATPDADASAELTEETTIASLAMDSLRLVEIIFEMERHFNTAADEGAMVEACTLGDIVSLFAVPVEECHASV